MNLLGQFATGQSASAPDPGASGTITTTGVGVARVNPSGGSRSGCILQAGTQPGQEVWVVNEHASNTITFAASGTSHVADGVSDVIAANSARKFVYDSTTSLWYKASCYRSERRERKWKGWKGESVTTALTVYSTNTNATTISTARTLVTGTGAASTNAFTSKCGTSTGYSEIFSQGTTNAWAAAGSIGSPSGNGFLLDATTLEGQQIVAGTWTPTFRGKTSGGTVTADIYVRAYVYNGGTYTQIGSNMSLTGQTLTTTSTNFAFSGTSQPARNFHTGDKLYVDCWLNITANSTGSSSATVGVVEAVSSTQGNAASFLVATPGYLTQEFILCDGYGGVYT